MSRFLKLSLVVLVAVIAIAPLFTPDIGTVQSEALYIPAPVEDLAQAAATLLAALIGIPAFIAGALGLLEFYGKITPGQSDNIQIYANSILYVLAFLAVLFGFTDVLHTIDHYLGGIAPILVALLALVSGAVHSIATTKRLSEHIRFLHPFRLKATLRI